jgi:hypothetical protein
VIDGEVVKTTTGNCYLDYDDGFSYTGYNDTMSNKTITLSVRLSEIRTSGTITSNSVVYI